MSKMRNPLIDPQPGDVVELGPGWQRTVAQRVGEWVVFYGESFECSVESWQRACGVPTARVVRRGEDA